MWNKPKNSNFSFCLLFLSPHLSSSISFHAAEMYLLYLPIVHERKLYIKNHSIFMRTRWWLLHLIASAVTFLLSWNKFNARQGHSIYFPCSIFQSRNASRLIWDKNSLIPSYLARSTLVAMPINLSHTISRTHRHTRTHIITKYYCCRKERYGERERDEEEENEKKNI